MVKDKDCTGYYGGYRVPQSFREFIDHKKIKLIGIFLFRDHQDLGS